MALVLRKLPPAAARISLSKAAPISVKKKANPTLIAAKASLRTQAEEIALAVVRKAVAEGRVAVEAVVLMADAAAVAEIATAAAAAEDTRSDKFSRLSFPNPQRRIRMTISLLLLCPFYFTCLPTSRANIMSAIFAFA